MLIIIFWEMTPCGSYKNRRFGGSYRIVISQKMIIITVNPTWRIYPYNRPWRSIRLWDLEAPQDHSAAERVSYIEKSNNLIGNPTRDLPACCSMVPQPTMLSGSGGMATLYSENRTKHTNTFGEQNTVSWCWSRWWMCTAVITKANQLTS
jgi:hypothetical protein